MDIKRLLFLMTVTIALIAACCFQSAAQKAFSVSESQPGFEFPAEVKPFVEEGMKAIAYVKGDLNGDRMDDYIIVSEKTDRSPKESSSELSRRRTLLIVRDIDGELNVGARNESVVFCGECGGGMGDPFDGISIDGDGFSVTNFGGTRERWIRSFDFKYSPRDHTWRLTRVEETNFDSTDPDRMQKKIYTSAKHFGRINFSDFDPENFRGKGGALNKTAAKKRRAAKKTREAIIYVPINVQTKDGAESVALFPVKRRVRALTPIAGAIKALLSNENDEELAGFGVPYELRFVSMRLEKGKAYIRLAYDESEIECCWGATMSLFHKALEKTVRQFPEVKEIHVCANGVENFLIRDPEYQRKCSWK